jgi:hypothetical protein
MKNIKSHLTIKKVADYSEIEIGDICLINGLIVLRDFDNNLKFLKYESSDFIIYGIRVPVKSNLIDMTDDTIERVLIKRKVSPSGNIIDEEITGDDTNLVFTKINDTFTSLHPFDKMIKRQIDVVSNNGNSLAAFSSSTRSGGEEFDNHYIRSSFFTKLPLFYKNKEKTKIVDGVEYDYYLISDIHWVDFKPVESHLKDNGDYANEIWIESDWHVADLASNEETKSSYFDGDFVINSDNEDIPTYCINSLVWFDYLYYIYMIKTASFRPFLDESKWTFDITKAYNFIYYDGSNYKMLQTNDDYIENEQLDLAVTFDDTYPNTMLVISSSLFQSHSEYLQKICDDLNKFNHCLVLRKNGTSEIYYVCVKSDAFVNGEQIYIDISLVQSSIDLLSSTYTVLLIKSIPYNTDEVYPATNDRSYFDEHRFCVDYISNIFPVFFKPFYFMEKDLSELITYDLNVITASSLNYDTFIDCGFRSCWLNESTSKKRNLFGTSENSYNYPLNNLKIPYFNGVCSAFELSNEISNNVDISSSVNNNNEKLKMMKLTNGIASSSFIDGTNFVARGNLQGKLKTNKNRTIQYDGKYFNEFLFYIGIFNGNFVYKNNGNMVSVDSDVEFGWNNFSLIKNGYHVKNFVDNSSASINKKDIYTITRLMFYN